MTRGLVALLALASLACTEEKVPVSFVIPDGEEPFLDTPWPSDLYVTSDGLDLGNFPNPTGSIALLDVLHLFEHNTAFAATQTMYFRVEGGVDERSLPQSAAASLKSDAMFLVELRSKHRVPLDIKVYNEGTRFLPKGTVAWMPLLGAVPRGPFALVVTSAALAKSGKKLGPSEQMLQLMRCEKIDNKRAPDCDAYQDLLKDLDLAAEDTALISIVTPGDPTGALRKGTRALLDAAPPAVSQISKRPDDAFEDYVVYDGVVQLQTFQKGSAPFDVLDGSSGGFVLDSDGVPQAQRTEDVPFVLTVPKTPMPVGGYPVVLNGHGTGGDLESGLGDTTSDTAWQLAQVSTCMLAISEPLHRTRRGYREGQENVLTFNFFNPLAGRDNWRESSLEKVQMVSMAQHVVLPVDPAAEGGETFHLDADRVAYFGHSQGGIVGALFVATDSRIRGAFLSGAGAGFGPSLVEKVDPVEIADVLRLALSLPDDEEIDIFHPVISLLQSFVDPADPINYGRAWREGSGKVPHLLVTSGLLDTFTPPRQHEGLAGSFGIPLAKPVHKDIEVLDVLDIAVAPRVVDGNLQTVDGDPLTAAMFQYDNHGHFAVFDDVGAQGALRAFFRTLMEGVPRVENQ